MNEPERKPVRVRYAPSPTGLQHIGGLRTALYNYLYAKKLGGQFILRIEDTDQKRFVTGALENTMNFLHDFGLHYDEGPILLAHKDTDNDVQGMLSIRYPGVYELGQHAPYIQSERLEVYQAHVDKLVARGSAYYCFCTEERLTDLRTRQETIKQPPRYDRICLKLPASEVKERRERGETSVIRFRIPNQGRFTVSDILRGDAHYDSADLDDFILMKSDGYPTYHLANVVDDHLMQITHVLRAVEWLPSLPKHVLLYQAFDWVVPNFAHLSVILGKDGRKKLSKREGDVSVDSFVEAGYLRPALLNFIALLGWNPGAGSTQEIFTLEELVQVFSLEHLNKAGAVFDRAKLDWMNHEYIKRTPSRELLSAIQTGHFLEKKEWFPLINQAYLTDTYLLQVLALEQERLKTLAQFGDDTQCLLVDSLEYDAQLITWKDTSIDVTRLALEKAQVLLERFPDTEWTRERLTQKLLEAAGERRGEFLWPLRVALTGAERSPSPMDIAWVLGKERTLQRVRVAREKIES